MIVALLALEFLVAGRRPHAVGFREAAAWSVVYVGVAIGFGVALGAIAGWDFGAQYFAGYVVEKSLSVDNLFVFVIIMSTFAVPPEHAAAGADDRHRRSRSSCAAVFIALGAALLDAFSFMFLVFGVLLLVTAVQLYRHRDQDPSIEDNVLVVGRPPRAARSPTATTAAGSSPASAAGAC